MRTFLGGVGVGEVILSERDSRCKGPEAERALAC